MEIPQQLLAFIDVKYVPAFTVAVTLFSLLLKLAAPLLSALEAHDKHFVRKPMERLKALRSSAAKNPDLSQYLESSIELEAFRIASGINTSRAKMEFLLALNKDGTWTKPQLRSVCRHLEVADDDGKPKLIIRGFDKFVAYWSVSASTSFALFGATVFTLLAAQSSVISFITGAGTFVVCLLFARFILSDYIHYKIARRAQAVLAKQQGDA
ncbi:hypothetical protein ACEVAQ_24300 [Ectopseudomonas khazarica]|uniref:Uncharacterized protein n=1 Tax=Ectopseudomonas khazarica TaxID=2502979 RepID=A0ABW7MMN5_9GAMM